MKTLVYVIIAILVLVGGFFAFNSYIYNEKQGDTTVLPLPVPENTGEIDGPKGEMGENPEGEADPNRMTLDMTKWNWISLTDAQGVKVVPKKASAFTLAFKKDGTFGMTTDCNSGGGNYNITGNKIVFSKMMSTLMACGVESQEGEYRQIFENQVSYIFTSRGELIITLKNGSIAVFR